MTLRSWQDVRRIADDIALQIHLGGMEMRDRWYVLKERVTDVETRIDHAGGRIDDAIGHEVAELRTALLHLRDDIYGRARADFATGW